ncbi:MAG: NAD(P)-binding domain-containing protein [Crocinitomicaceae bacterium]|nr:NAD(P)-binding domain-containing protein [Crocinitomicaceae bacterium]
MQDKKYAIIGAGPSGLSCAKVFSDMGISFQGYEASEFVGGLWNFNNPQSALYPNVHVISSKKRLEFKHFPMQDIQEDYPHHTKVFQYLKQYAAHYDLNKSFRFNTSIKRLVRLQSEEWEIELESGEKHIYSGVIIASGLYSAPSYPKFEDVFSGDIIHSGTIKEYDSFKNKRVLIIGAGNSGCDIACDLSRLNGLVGLSMRHGNYIIPKYLLGKPADSTSFGANLPIRIKQFIHEKFIGIVSGKFKNFGLQKPPYRIYEKHPVINSQLRYQIGHGHIKIHREAVNYEGKRVFFSDGTSDEFDTLIMATGFKLEYSFIDNEHLNWEDGCPHLFLNIFNKSRLNLFVMGLVSSVGLGWDGRYQQAMIIGKYLNAKEHSKLTASKFEERMQNYPDLSGGYKYKVPAGGQYYVNNRAYLKLLKKGIKFLSHG